MSTTDGAALFKERSARLADNIALRETDRAPYTFWPTFWPAKLGGITYKEAWYDIDKMVDATRDAIHLLEPDSFSPLLFSFGPVMEAMGYKAMYWPGKGVGDNVTFQYLDDEYVSAEEYDDYLFDPTGFYLKSYLPRIATAFEGFANMPTLPSLSEWRFFASLSAFADPKLQESMKQLMETGEKMAEILGAGGKFIGEMAAEGYPVSVGGFCKAPFDHILDFLRGSKGGMLDMFRRPDKMHETLAKARRLLIDNVVNEAKSGDCPIVFMPLHWGLDTFMSHEQFMTFYWPELRAIVLELIENDCVPCLLWEGDCTSRMEFIGDIPPGKAIYWFEQGDLFKAKEILGDVVCLRGNVPPSLLNTGTPEDVDEYCGKLIKTVGKGGGFILDGAIGIPDEARVENVVAMANSVKKYAN
jgi:uroporphyrinogen-III decarboxylase